MCSCCSGLPRKLERQAFRQLVKISGVGARTALSLLSGLSVSDLHHAVTSQDSARLVRIPGIGKKTAERLLLELRDKLICRYRRGESDGRHARFEGRQRRAECPAVSRL